MLQHDACVPWQTQEVIVATERWFKGVIRDPMVHFVILGCAMFATSEGFSNHEGAEIIEVTTQQVERLRMGFMQREGSAPDAQQMSERLNAFIDEELLVRRARQLGLDRDDPVVRRRLVQKMEVLMGNPEDIPEPDDAILDAWLNAHPDLFARPTRITLEHVFFDRTRRGGTTASDAREARVAVVAGAPSTSVGDPFLRGARFAQQTLEGLRGVFGVGFAREAFALPLGEWRVLESSYGYHVARVVERAEVVLPSLDQCRPRVLRHWRQAEAATQRARVMETMRTHYRIVMPTESGAAN